MIFNEGNPMRNNQSAPSISISPDELLSLVFSHLNPRDLLNAEQVAKRWQQSVMSFQFDPLCYGKI